jgi:hypothetical protein
MSILEEFVRRDQQDCQLSARFERPSAKKSQPKFKMMNLQINDPDKLDDTYNLTSAIKMMKTHHIKYDLHDVFNIVFPDAMDCLDGNRTRNWIAIWSEFC